MNDRPLVIAGSGRSGTTWILDVIAETNNLRTVFEPLNPLCVDGAQKFANSFLKDAAAAPELKEFLERVFAGKLNSVWTKYRLVPCYLKPYPSSIKSWTDFYNLLAEYKKFCIRYVKSKKNVPENYIVKFIRANLLIGWMEKNFNIRLIFVVRHPCSVILSKIVASRLSKGSVWKFNDHLQQDLLNKYSESNLWKWYKCSYYDIFNNELSEVAWHAAIWCIENLFPVYKLQEKNHPIFFYEDIVRNPEREFDRMNSILGLIKKPESFIVSKPSQQASQEFNSQANISEKLNRWMNVFNRKELYEIDQILNIFNVTLYNTCEPTPISRIQEPI